ncbi:uncharacterized protein AAG666_013697 [Megaptera novaeangliae]
MGGGSIDGDSGSCSLPGSAARAELCRAPAPAKRKAWGEPGSETVAVEVVETYRSYRRRMWVAQLLNHSKVVSKGHTQDLWKFANGKLPSPTQDASFHFWHRINKIPTAGWKAFINPWETWDFIYRLDNLYLIYLQVHHFFCQLKSTTEGTSLVVHW